MRILVLLICLLAVNIIDCYSQIKPKNLNGPKQRKKEPPNTVAGTARYIHRNHGVPEQGNDLDSIAEKVNLEMTTKNPEAPTGNQETTTRKPWVIEPRHENVVPLAHQTVLNKKWKQKLSKLKYIPVENLKGCKEGEFKCDADLCVSEVKRCDGRVNCVDRTDEEDCDQVDIVDETKKRKSLQSCKEGEFKCDADLCVSVVKRCDGRVNCADRTDEEDCDQVDSIDETKERESRQGCSAEFNHASGTIVHPIGGGNYQNNEDCVWIIRAGLPMKILFTSFQVETNYDNLKIRDGDSSDSSLIGEFTGHTIPNPVETDGNAAYIRFTSDYSVTFPGFELHWAPSGCGGEYTTSNGVIRHPMNGGNYENNENCFWKITAAEPIQITFVRFDLEANYDFLYVRDGANSDSPLLGSFTGSTLPSPVQTAQNSAFLLFSSDYSVTKTGFEIRWEPASTTGSGCACGQVNRASRIVNGIATEENEYPWQAAMVFSDTSRVLCGGSVIGSKHILTAAHCTQAVTDYGYNYQVLVGAHRLSSPASSQIRLEAATFTQHANYDPSTYDNDIAIIELSSSIDFGSSGIKPVCLPESDDDAYDSITATVSGWGALESQGSFPDVLMEVDVPTMSNTQCLSSYSGGITENMLCAGYEEGGKDSCQGDSGGPLIYNSGNGYTQIGVVSWGYGCAAAGYPGVYARVTKYLSWISANSASSTSCPSDSTVCPEGFFRQSNQCFKFYPDETGSFTHVSSFCDGEGLKMAHPRDPIGLRRMMVPIYGHAEPWVNALQIVNSNNYQWQDDDTILPSSSSLWFPGQPEEYGQGCVILLVWDWRLDTNPDQPYYARPCSGYGPPGYGYYTLCELVLT